MTERMLLAAVIVAGASLAGCGLAPPRVGAREPVLYQQYRATLHDPYADQDAGPDTVELRPREFQQPLPEPVRSRWLRDSWWAQ
jgi:hypothetical protein